MSMLAIIISIIGLILTIINIVTSLMWKRKDYNYRKNEDDYKKIIQEENQKYIENFNNKKELIDFINNFIELGYKILMESTSFLYSLKYNISDLKNNEAIKKEKLEELLTQYFDIKKDVNILKTKSTHLYLHSKNSDEIALIGGTFNEIYFLNELINEQLMKHYKKENINNKKILHDIKRALTATEETLKIMNQLDSVLVNKISILYSNEEGYGTITFVRGTEYFKWYFPKYPYKVVQIKKEDILNKKENIIK